MRYTRAQAEVLHYLEFHLAKHGETPTHGELAAHLNVHRSRVGQVVSELVRRGAVHVVCRYRGIRLGPKPPVDSDT